MKGIYWPTLTFKKSVIYLIKVNYTSYNDTPFNSRYRNALYNNTIPSCVKRDVYP